MKTKDLRSLVGQFFIVGFNGYSVPPDFRKFIQDFHLGGVIYFKRNVQSAAQLAELSNELQFSCRPDADPGIIISIDHEGGKINRLVKPFTKFPGNDYLGELASPKIGFDFGMVIAKELKAVGINMNFAPVVDVYTNTESQLIRNRAFSSDPEVCAKLGSAVCRGIQKMGVMAVAKHFPGHGDVREDSHFDLPKVEKSFEALEQCELIPFRRCIRARVEGVMTAHILNPLLDAEYPATLSEKTLKYLRTEMRFNKLIIADDLEMKAIADHYSLEQATVLAINAGCDQIIFRGDVEPPVSCFEAVIQAVEKKAIPLEKIEQAVSRIQQSKKQFINLQAPVDVTSVGNFIGLPEHFRLADLITRGELPSGHEETESH